MYFVNPVGDGIRIEASYATIWIGWTYSKGDYGKRMLLHFHFIPDTTEVHKEIYNDFSPYWEAPSQRARNFTAFKRINYHGPHQDYGCLMPLLNLDHKEMAEINNAILRFGSESTEVKASLKKLLKKIFGS